MMRTTSWLAGVLFCVGLAGSAQAQAVGFGPTTGPIRYQVISTDNPNGPISGTQSVSVNNSPNRFFRSSTGRISNSTVFGSSQFPSESQLPGEDYLKAFHVKRYAKTVPSSWWQPWTWF